ncbi:MAG: hypothetical protein V4696_01460 [Pseudomonadota bacterium]
MKGAREAFDRQTQLGMFTAWQIARLTVYHGDKPFEPLGKYLEKLKPQPPRRRQTPAEMIAALRAIKATVAN